MAPRLAQIRARSAALGDQFERALTSVPLNIAEGSYSRGRTRQLRHQTAAASAREALACWETAEALGWVPALEGDAAALFNRVIGALVRLCGWRRSGGSGRARAWAAGRGESSGLRGVGRK